MVCKPLRRWRPILQRTYTEYHDDQVSIVASGVAFRVALAMFPGIALLVWIGTLFVGTNEAQALIEKISAAVPDSSRSIIMQAVQSSVKNNPADAKGQYGFLGSAAPLAGLLFVIYSTNTGMQALFNALNAIYDTKERRGVFAFYGTTLLFTIGMVISILVTATIAVALPFLLTLTGLVGPHLFGLTLLRWPILFLGISLALTLLYHYAPNRNRESWRLATFGSMLASLLIVLGTALFSWFTSRFASLAVTYGSLSTMIAFMLWLWASFWIVLACAELDSCIEAETCVYGDTPKIGTQSN